MYPPEEELPVAPIEEIPEEITAQQPLVEQKDIDDALIHLLRFARDDDRAIRDNYIYTWKRLDYYWNNILDIFYDPIARNWTVPNWDELDDEIPPRLINIFRPHGEAIVAALSVTIPGLVYPPDDAENPDDLEASVAYGNITELLQRHNDAAMLLIRSLVIMFTSGTIFGYNYAHQSPKFGTIKKAKIEPKDVNIFEARCPECGAPLDAGLLPEGAETGNSEGVNPVAQPNSQIYQCEQCGYQGPGEVTTGLEKLPQIVGFDETPKSSICQEVFSGLQVKVPAYCKKQDDCGYLLLEFMQSVAMLRSLFRNRADEIDSRRVNYGDTSFAKLPPQYLGQLPDNAANVSCLWLRPWQFWELGTGKLEVIEYFEKTYPDGAYCLFVNDLPFEIYPENMDEHWTFSENPLGSTVYSRPLSENLATVQDIRANLVEIEVQTAEHGIPETFVDGKVLDFDKYGQGRAKPGMMTKVKPRPGRTINEAFFTTNTATLSQEIDPLRQHIDQDAQFVTGSFPSVYGGPSTGGSKTASEYAQSKAQALQRLGTFWKIICVFWGRFQGRSAVEYANILKDLNQDERFVKKQGTSYINVWIRTTSLNGKVGQVEPEATEQLPQSWAQKKEAILELFGQAAGIPEVLQTLVHPNNAGLIKRAVGLDELYIPGEEDRIRQSKEFVMMSQGIMVPTNEFDNDQIHLMVLDAILEGQLGEQLEQGAMQICLQHRMEHEFKVAQQMAQQQASAENGADEQQSEKKPKENVK